MYAEPAAEAAYWCWDKSPIILQNRDNLIKFGLRLFQGGRHEHIKRQGYN